MQFEPMPKIPRLFRDVVITEKLDGTNACVIVPEDPAAPVQAGSKTRLLAPGKQTDNFGFAAWVQEHAEELRTLGPGLHRGEWWGAGIQRGYGLTERRFSLFNVAKWSDPAVRPACCQVVPVLFRGALETEAVLVSMHELRTVGSYAAPGFMRPEGVVVFHTASGYLFKATLENDEQPKGVSNG